MFKTYLVAIAIFVSMFASRGFADQPATCSGGYDCVVVGAIGAVSALVKMDAPNPQSLKSIPDSIVVQCIVGQKGSDLVFPCGVFVLKIQENGGSDKRELQVNGSVFAVAIKKESSNFHVGITLKKCGSEKVYDNVKAGAVIIAKFDSSCK